MGFDSLVNDIMDDYQPPTDRGGGTSGGGAVECLLSRPVPPEGGDQQNTCWMNCQEQQRERERQCDQLFTDIENALRARGCPARIIPDGPPGMGGGAGGCPMAGGGCASGSCSMQPPAGGGAGGGCASGSCAYNRGGYY